jgi:hypothetical protein
MIVCPVCEHAQAQGAECEVCGKKLLHGAAAIPRVPPVEGLEPTHHAPVDADASGEAVPGLEPTHHGEAADAPAEPVLELEAGRAAPVDVPSESVPDLERVHEAVPGDARTAIPAFVTCRYCRTPAPAGERVCGRCGMRLPVFAVPAPTPAADAPARLCSCGAPITGARCRACGARVS